MIYLDKTNGYRLLALAVVPSDFVHGFGDVLQNQIQVDLVLLQNVANF